MAKTQISCPRCRQPVVIDVEQLFDVGADPQSKQRFLSGAFNRVMCRNCGFDGPYPTPLVYHDPEKELLLTYFPPELGVPVNQQERQIGPLITRVTNALPPEKRKAYLLRPQTMFTSQLMLEKVLEADGITKEMIESQQRKLNLIQRLASASAEQRPAIIQQEVAEIDEAFFALVNRLIEVSMAQNDEKSAEALGMILQDLFDHTELGKEIKAQALEEQAVINELQKASQQGLTREKLTDLLVNAPSERALAIMVAMTRSALDYTFFQSLTDTITRTADAEQQKKLVDLREKLLQMTAEIDKAVQKRLIDARNLLEKILAQTDLNRALQENAEHINQQFVEVLNTELQVAKQKADLERINKLQALANAIQEASAPPEEFELLNKLLTVESDEERLALLKENAELVTPEFMQMFNAVLAQEDQQPAEIRERLQAAYGTVLRFTMTQNLSK